MILITGISRGIGFETAKHLLETEPTIKVIGIARSCPEPLTALLAQYPTRLLFYSMDLSTNELNWKDLERLVAQTFLSPVSLSAVIHNAGVLQPTGYLSQVKEIEKAFQVNVFSMISLWQWSVSYLRETKGRFIAVSSGAATRAYESLGVYCASKAAMNMFIQTMAKEEPTITCLALRPGVVETEMQVFVRENGPLFGMNPQDSAKFKSLHDNGQVIPAHEAGAFLAKISIHCPLHLSGEFLSWDDPQWQ